MERPDLSEWPDNGWSDVDTYPVSYVQALHDYIDWLEERVK